MLVIEHGGSVLHRTDARLFPALEFLVQLLQHLPEPRSHLVRCYGLYSSRSRGTLDWKALVVRLAPEGRLQQHPQQPTLRMLAALRDSAEPSVSTRESRSSRARLLAKVHEVDAPHCSHCGSPMKVLAVVTDPPEVRRILLHLIKTGVAPPGVEASLPN